MIVAGGAYREECILPQWSRIFGSGGRAAAAIALRSSTTTLNTYASRLWANDLRASMDSFGVATQISEIDYDICFSYFHPLSRPNLDPQPIDKAPALLVEGNAILRFGFVEGSAIVNGDRVVYDPQNWKEALLFSSNGSKARELAVVLNEFELLRSTREDDEGRAVESLRQQTSASTIVVKRGPRGAVVYEGGTRQIVPAYMADSVFKIGSGDVFSGIFAVEWAERHLPAAQAADAASRAVAYYVSSRSAQIPAILPEEHSPAPAGEMSGSIYLAAPFFTLSQRWLVEEALNALEGLGATVFSPLHEVGIGQEPREIARQELEGLRMAKVVFAILDGEDPGTMFEIGYARAHDKPVVVLAEATQLESLTMFIGSGCTIESEFVTAIYRTIWALLS